MRRHLHFIPLAIGILLLCLSPVLAQQQLGKIIGQIRVARGDVPSHPILISLELHGAAVASVYTDGQGRFGFYSLESNPYHLTVGDDAYNPVDELVSLNTANSPVAIIGISLVPRDSTRPQSSDRVTGGNANLIDPAEYTRRFPKKTQKEFQKGVEADGQGRHDEAIEHYEKAISLSPDFYPAHNNLGSAELRRSNLAGARQEFEQVVKLNQSDAAAYFNLSNVCMLTGQLADAQRFLEEGLRRQPESAFGKFLLGSLDLRAGKMAEAEGALRQAIQLNPSMTQARLQLVNLFLQQSRKQDAIAMLRDFVVTFPADPFAGRATQLLQKLDPSWKAPHNAK